MQLVSLSGPARDLESARPLFGDVYLSTRFVPTREVGDYLEGDLYVEEIEFLPGATLQGFKFPKLKIKLPSFKFKFPKIRLPKIKLPKLKLPAIKLPKIKLPNIKMPNIDLGKAFSSGVAGISKGVGAIGELGSSIFGAAGGMLSSLMPQGGLQDALQDQFPGAEVPQGFAEDYGGLPADYTGQPAADDSFGFPQYSGGQLPGAPQAAQESGPFGMDPKILMIAAAGAAALLLMRGGKKGRRR